MDWDEDEPPTQSRGFDEIEPLPEPGDEDVTRQVRVDETFPGLRSAETGEYPPTLDAAPVRQPPSAHAPVPAPDLPTPVPERAATARAYLPVVAVVVGIIVVIVVGLQAFGSRAGATIRFSTEPPDAIVTVDGVRAPATASPFVLSELAPDVDHTINVAKPGFSQWSTKLRVRGGKVLDLPTITLERQPGATPEPPPPPPTAAAPAQEAGAPELPAPAPVAPAPAAHPRPSTPSPAPVVSHAKEKPPAVAHPSAPAHPVSSSGGAKGTLRLNTRPWSKVTIDGKPAGNTPLMNLSLSAGSHKVKLVNPDFGISKTITIDIAAGQTVTKVLTLQ